jgi:hypothetical protein
MKISQGERETLTGPAVVGAVLGIVLAVCAVSVISEYNAAALFDWTTVGDTMLISFGGFLLAFVPFGLVPVLIGRCRLGNGNKTK